MSSHDSKDSDNSKKYRYVRADLKTVQSAPNATSATLMWAVDGKSDYTLSANGQSLKVNKDGFYLITCGAQFQASPSGRRSIGVLVNGQLVDDGLMDICASDVQAVGPNISTVAQLKLSANDTIGARVYQSSGKNLSVAKAHLRISQLDQY